jgi:hypothetical protein
VAKKSGADGKQNPVPVPVCPQQSNMDYSTNEPRPPWYCPEFASVYFYFIIKTTCGLLSLQISECILLVKGEKSKFQQKLSNEIN